MIVWSVASQKGGVGKTTTVASLAGWMQKERLKVLVVDTDPHASLTSYLGFEDENLDRTLYDLYAARHPTRELVRNIIIHSNYAGLDLIPASMTLATIDRQLSGRVGVGRIVAFGLDLIEDLYDAVIIDCPPVLGALMVNALVASSHVLVPTQTEFLALKGLEGMVRTFHIMNQADPDNGVDYLIVPTMFDRRTKASLQSIEFLRDNYQDKIWRGCIPVDTRFRESSSRRTPLPIMDSTSRGAAAYRELFMDMIKAELKAHPEAVTEACRAILDRGQHPVAGTSQRPDISSGRQASVRIRESVTSIMGDAFSGPPAAAVQTAVAASASAAATAPAAPAAPAPAAAEVVEVVEEVAEDAEAAADAAMIAAAGLEGGEEAAAAPEEPPAPAAAAAPAPAEPAPEPAAPPPAAAEVVEVVEEVAEDAEAAADAAMIAASAAAAAPVASHARTSPANKLQASAAASMQDDAGTPSASPAPSLPDSQPVVAGKGEA